MSTSPTVPMFDPQGTLRDIPYERMHEAVDAGGMIGHRVQAPDGKIRIVPANRLQEAAQQGGKVLPLEDSQPQQPGFWSSLGSDLTSMFTPGPSAFQGSPLHWSPGLNTQGAEKAALAQQEEAGATDRTRAAEGRSVPYRVVAGAAPLLGVNAMGMEESARQGDPGGVLGHAAAVPTMMAAGELVRATGPPSPDPALLQSGGLASAPEAVPASQTGEALGAQRPPLIQQVRALPPGQYQAPASPLPPPAELGSGVIEGEYMDEPPPAIRGQLPRGAIPQPGGFEPTQLALPARGQPIRLPAEFPPPRQPIIRTTPSAPLQRGAIAEQPRAPLVEQMRTSVPAPEPEIAAPPASLVEQVRQWPPEPEVAAPQSRLVDRMQEGTEEQNPSLKVQATKDYPRLVEQVTRPVTENPVVGSFVRAMQKSGMPIAKRPNLLLKGSGRVNRILGPNEDLTDILGKSARQARRAREQ